MLRDGLVSWLDLDAKPRREKRFDSNQQEEWKEKEEKCSHEMIGPLSQKFEMQNSYPSLVKCLENLESNP
jgi:hypothetical protein